MENHNKFIDIIGRIVILRLGNLGAEELTDEDYELINTCYVINCINRIMYTYVTHTPLKDFKDKLEPYFNKCKEQNKNCICTFYDKK